MKYNILFYGFCAFIISACNNQPPKTEEPKKFWGHHYAVMANVPYGSDPAQIADVYTQGSWAGNPLLFKLDTTPYPTLIWIHGGGWIGGIKETSLPFFATFLERGWNVVNLEYRKGNNTSPNAVDDVMMAIHSIMKHHKKMNIDPNNIVLSGGSAGGHLALMGGLLNSLQNSHPYYAGDSLKVRAVINWYGVTNLNTCNAFLDTVLPNDNYVRAWVGEKFRETYLDSLSPLTYVQKNAPPILTVHGTDDDIVPVDQAIELHKLLDSLGLKNKFLMYEGGKHVGFTEDQFQDAYTEIFKFVDAEIEH